jgi:hypothetical protein
MIIKFKDMITFDELFHRLPKELTDNMKKSRQSPKWHKEGNCDIHTKLVFDLCQTNYPEDKELLLCAIFHDLGKPETQKITFVDGEEKITNHGHEKASMKYIERFFDLYSDVSTDYDKVWWICDNHMRMHLYNNGEMKESKRQLLESNKWFQSLLHFSYCDEMRGTEFYHGK